MGKGSSNSSPPPAPSAPAYSGGTFMYGSQPTATQFKTDNGVVSQYLPNQSQQDVNNQGWGNISSLLGGLGQTPSDLASQYQKMGDAYTQNATDTFNRQLQPTLRGIREDAAQRFGTLNATPYTDALQQLQEQTIQPAYQQIANQGTLMGQDLYTQGLQNQLAQLTGNEGAVGANDATMLNNLAAAQSGANSANNFNQQNYQGALSAYGNQLNYLTNLHNQSQSGTNALVGLLGNLGGAAVGSIFGPVGTALGSAAGTGLTKAFGGP